MPGTKDDAMATEHSIKAFKHEQQHFVGIRNLRVVITNDDGSWFAQALEIDYAAEGASLEHVQRCFEDGLKSTVNEHLRLFGTIDKLISPAPSEVWREVLKADPQPFRYSQLSLHSFPYVRIEYLKKAA